MGALPNLPTISPILNTSWLLDIDGIPAGLVKSVKSPKKEVMTLLYGNAANDMDTKIPGKASVDQLSFDIILSEKPLPEPFQRLLELAALGTPLAAQVFTTLTLLDATGTIPVAIFEFGYSFVKSAQLADLKTKSSEQDILYKAIVMEVSDCKQVFPL